MHEQSNSPENSLFQTITIESNLFECHKDAVFWVGMLAVGDQAVEGLENEYRASHLLRAQVYIDEFGYLPDSTRQIDGGEWDENDQRSVHFGVVEKVNNKLMLRGTARLISKYNYNLSSKLPIEDYFSEVFHNSAPIGSVEASRFIARHPDKYVQHAISLALIRSIVAEAADNNSPFIYAVVENHLLRMFQKINLLHEVIGPPKYIEDYKSENIGLRFDPVNVLNQARNDAYGHEILINFFQTVNHDMGLGYYDETLSNKVH